MRFGVRRVRSECIVRLLATFVIFATVDNIGVDAGRRCPDVGRITLETRMGGVVVIAGTGDGWFDQTDQMHDASLVMCIRIVIIIGVRIGGVIESCGLLQGVDIFGATSTGPSMAVGARVRGGSQCSFELGQICCHCT